MTRTLARAVVALLLGASLAHAQGDAANDDGFAIAAGYSWKSPRQWGIITNRAVVMLDLARETQLARGRDWSVVHTLELPVSVVTRRSSRTAHACWPRHPWAPCIRDTSAAATVGVGVLPLGLKLYLGSSGLSRLYVSAAGGVLAFSSPMPTSASRRLNFTAQAGVGVELPSVGRRAVSVGYKYVHMSNGDTAPSNPGLDANLVFVRVSFRSASPESREPASASR